MCEPRDSARRPYGFQPIDETRSQEYIYVRNGELSKATRVYLEGMQIGCTFVSKEAIEIIIDRWRKSRSE